MGMQPKVTVTWRCDHCGVDYEIISPITQDDELRGGNKHVVTCSTPTGWTRIGEKLLCERHAIKIRSVITVDGVESEVVRDWSNG